MPRLNWLSRAICAAVVCASLVSAASAQNFVEFLVSRQEEDDRYRAGIYVEVSGATAVELLPDGGGTLPFYAPPDDPSGFFLQTCDFATLAALNASIDGTHTLRMTHAGGISDYEYTRALITEDMFAKVPALGTVPASIPQNYNFQWTWSGTADDADEMYAHAEIFDKLSKEDDDEGGFTIGQTTSWTPDFSPETGHGRFVIDYSFIGDVELGTGITISGWELVPGGDELFGGVHDEIDDCIDSQDMAYFTVVPEPATMGLLALGGMGLLRRKSKIPSGRGYAG